MVTIEIPDELHARLQAFRLVVEAVIEEPLSDEDYVALLLDQAPSLMLAELVPYEASVLLQSLQGLAVRHPAEVYGYVVEVLRAGAVTPRQPPIAGQIGFRPPSAIAPGHSASESSRLSSQRA